MQGLGKTVQVAATLALLFHSRLARRVLLVLPVSLTPNWTKELRSWCPSIPLFSYSGAAARREKQRQACLRGGGILVTTYGLLASQQGSAAFTSYSPPPSSPDSDEWDALILDEGHRIKNPDIRLTRTVKAVSCRFRVILSGTPIQNDLAELWCLMDFACSGRLLGEKTSFRTDWSQPIQDGFDRNASREEKHKAQQLTQQLQDVIAPHMLRRDKREIMQKQKAAQQQQQRQLEGEGGEASGSSSSSFSFLSAVKNDVIVWLYLSEVQTSLYSTFISSPEVKAALNSTRSPLASLTVLKKICDHPRLLHQQMKHCQHLFAHGQEAQRPLDDEEEVEAEVDSVGAAFTPLLPSAESLDAESLLRESCKLRLLLRLLSAFREEGVRALVFSQSVKMLDLIAAVLSSTSAPFSFLRIDGSVKLAEERQRRIDEFSTPSSPHSLLLLTTGVGGVGLNLTAACRCVIFDPSWNPAVDSQSVDRCYRIGQTRDVVVYRFITCGTVEEVIYRKQIFKQGIQTSIHTKGDGQPQADGAALKGGYFTRQELREVFSLRDHRWSDTQRQLALLHPPEQRRSYAQLDEQLRFVEQQKEEVFGLSDHDLLFHTEAHNPPPPVEGEGNEEEEGSRRRAQAQVSSTAPTPALTHPPSAQLYPSLLMLPSLSHVEHHAGADCEDAADGFCRPHLPSSGRLAGRGEEERERGGEDGPLDQRGAQRRGQQGGAVEQGRGGGRGAGRGGGVLDSSTRRGGACGDGNGGGGSAPFDRGRPRGSGAERPPLVSSSRRGGGVGGRGAAPATGDAERGGRDGGGRRSP